MTLVGAGAGGIGVPTSQRLDERTSVSFGIWDTVCRLFAMSGGKATAGEPVTPPCHH